MKPPTAKKPRNSAESVEATIRTYDRELRGFLLRRLRGRAESPEDVKQEIYLRMLRFTDAELVREPRAYLYQVARNVLHDRLQVERKQAFFTARTDKHQSEHSQDEAEDTAEQIANARELEHVLSKLPPLYRAVIVLRKGEGLNYVEIARKLDLSIHTVKKYTHLALAQIRAISLELSE